MEIALIDTSILIEPFTPWKNNEPNYKQLCLALLQDKLYPFRKQFKPVISLGVIGEFNLIVHEKSYIKKELEDKRERIGEITQHFFNRCEFVGLSRETIALCNQIFYIDDRMDPLDALHIATAISEKCQNFMFIDYALKENIEIKKSLCLSTPSGVGLS